MASTEISLKNKELQISSIQRTIIKDDHIDTFLFKVLKAWGLQDLSTATFYMKYTVASGTTYQDLLTTDAGLSTDTYMSVYWTPDASYASSENGNLKIQLDAHLTVGDETYTWQTKIATINVQNNLVAEIVSALTPDLFEQLKTYFDNIKADVLVLKEASEAAQVAAELAQTGAQTAQGIAQAQALLAVSSAEDADANAQAAEVARGLSVDAYNAAVAAKNDALSLVGDLESVATAVITTEAARDIAVAAKDLAVSSKETAVSSAAGAVSAKDAAVVAKEAAQALYGDLAAVSAAKTAAETAETNAETAQTASESARDASVAAKDLAVSAKVDAVAAKDITITAQDNAVTAKETALLAVTASESARDAILNNAGYISVLAEVGVAGNITIVATDINNVNIVAGDKANIDAVVANKTNIDAVVGNATNINAVNANKTNIDAVSANKTNIDAVNANKTNINLVAAAKANIDLLAPKAANIANLAPIAADITTVAGVSTEITALGARTTEIDALYAEIDNIGSKATVASVDAVKVKTVESDLAIADIRRDQTLANQSEAKITVSDYGIVALPKNATGSLKVKREGLTARQLVVNGNATTSVTSDASGTLIGLLLDGTWQFANTYSTAQQVFDASVGDKILVCTVLKSGSVGRITSQYLMYSDGRVTNRTDITGALILTDVLTVAYALPFNIKVSEGVSGLVERDYQMLINLTQTFGAGNEPTLAQCKNIFQKYFADTKNVPMTGRYRGLGKNLASTSDFYNTRLKEILSPVGTYANIVVANDVWTITNIGAQIYSNASVLIPVKEGETYTARYTNVSGGSYHSFALKNKRDGVSINVGTISGLTYYPDTIAYGVPSSSPITITFPAGINYLTYNIYIPAGTNNFIKVKNIQLELGSTATTYTPFEAHDLYLTAPEGRSVPSAKDSVEVVDGKLVHVKRVSDDTTIINPVFSLSATLTNVYRLTTTSAIYNSLPSFSTGYLATQWSLLVNGSTWLALSDFDDDYEHFYFDAGGLRMFVLKTTIDAQTGSTVAEKMNNWFNGVVSYQLATPITTPIDQDGAIQAGASVYWEPAIPDVGIYTTKFDILDTDHPISSIDKLYKVDFATGVQTQLTDAVIAGDGLSFTSASLTDGDLVNVIYFYVTANPEGLTTATYLNSNVVVADSANGKYYKYKPTITNGAIASWTVTEVV